MQSRQKVIDYLDKIFCNGMLRESLHQNVNRTNLLGKLNQQSNYFTDICKAVLEVGRISWKKEVK